MFTLSLECEIWDFDNKLYFLPPNVLFKPHHQITTIPTTQTTRTWNTQCFLSFFLLFSTALIVKQLVCKVIGLHVVQKSHDPSIHISIHRVIMNSVIYLAQLVYQASKEVSIDGNGVGKHDSGVHPYPQWKLFEQLEKSKWCHVTCYWRLCTTR